MNRPLTVMLFMFLCSCLGRGSLNAVNGSGSRDVWAVGDGGIVIHWDGSSWSRSATAGSGGYYERLFGVWANNSSDAWIVGEALLHWDGKAWTPGPSNSEESSEIFNAVWGTGQGDLWAVGYNETTAHFGGSSQPTFTRGNKKIILTGVTGTGPDDTWTVGWVEGDTSNGVLMGILGHGNITGWSGYDGATPSRMNGIWSISQNNVWAVGDNGTPLHWNGSIWSSAPDGPQAVLNGIWGSSPDDVWAVGNVAGRSRCFHFDGLVWSRVLCGTDHALNAVWGSSSNDVWAVGDGPTVVHWDGGTWSAVEF